MRHLAAIVPNQLHFSPGQRTRIEFWARFLEDDGWCVTFHPFEDDRLHEVLYQAGRPLAKAAAMLGFYARRFVQVMRGVDADVYYLYREAALIGPALTERVLAAKRPMVYDLDEPTWIPYRSPVNGWLSLLKFPGKIRSLIKMSDRVLAINESIANFARALNPAVTVVPICVDTDRYTPVPKTGDGPVRVGWIGSYSTVPNVESIARPLAQLQQRTGARVRIIGASVTTLPGVEVESEIWSAETEVKSLNECDIGVVPLIANRWNPWKFNFKTIQYMSLGLPVVAQRMGSNLEIVRDGVNGFLVDSEAEWLDRLELLARDPDRRRAMGAAARATVLERYSPESHIPRLLELFSDLAPSR